MEHTVSPESRILAAARSEFVAFGLRGARMQSIADRCGVNKALLHYYFRSKERLYEAVLKDIVQTMRTALESQLDEDAANGDIRTLLRRIITVYVRTLQRNPDIVRFMFREIAEGGNYLPELVTQVAPLVQDIPGRIMRRFGEEADAGTIRRMSWHHLMLNIIGMCIFTFVAQPVVTEISRQLRIDIDFDETFFDERIDTILDMVLHGIMTGPGRSVK